MKTSSNGRRFIEQFEGLKLKTYDDGTGVLTVGYGHTTAAGAPRVYRGQSITKEQADQILGSDLSKVENDVNRLVKVSINQNQFDALVSFHFNTGALARSSVLKKLNQGDYNDAANALLAYNHAAGRVMAGLTRRRQAERAMFLATPISAPSGAPTAVSVGLGAILVTLFKEHWIEILCGVGALAILIEYIIYRKKK